MQCAVCACWEHWVNATSDACTRGLVFGIPMHGCRPWWGSGDLPVLVHPPITLEARVATFLPTNTKTPAREDAAPWIAASCSHYCCCRSPFMRTGELSNGMKFNYWNTPLQHPSSVLLRRHLQEGVYEAVLIPGVWEKRLGWEFTVSRVV